jgi:hypothetical protein
MNTDKPQENKSKNKGQKNVVPAAKENQRHFRRGSTRIDADKNLERERQNLGICEALLAVTKETFISE